MFSFLLFQCSPNFSLCEKFGGRGRKEFEPPRTELPVDVALVETSAPPIYQRIAQKALHLQELGLSRLKIARQLEVDDKTVAKAIRWLQ